MSVDPPTVSVITPLFNKEEFLQECIDSVFTQSFPAWEFIIIDDGSTDDSLTIARKAETADPTRIKVLQHSDARNHGVSASRNLGLTHASGTFCAFLDADDVFMREKLAHDVRILTENSDSAAVISRALWWHSDKSQPDFMDKFGEPVDRIHTPPSLFRSVFLQGTFNVPCPCAVTIRRDVLSSTSSFDIHLRTWEDQKFFAELTFRFPVYVSGACVSKYRRVLTNSAWAAAVADGSDRENELYFLKWMHALLDAQRTLDPLILSEFNGRYLAFEKRYNSGR